MLKGITNLTSIALVGKTACSVKAWTRRLLLPIRTILDFQIDLTGMTEGPNIYFLPIKESDTETFGLNLSYLLFLPIFILNSFSLIPEVISRI